MDITLKNSSNHIGKKVLLHCVSGNFEFDQCKGVLSHNDKNSIIVDKLIMTNIHSDFNGKSVSFDMSYWGCELLTKDWDD